MSCWSSASIFFSVVIQLICPSYREDWRKTDGRKEGPAEKKLKKQITFARSGGSQERMAEGRNNQINREKLVIANYL